MKTAEQIVQEFFNLPKLEYLENKSEMIALVQKAINETEQGKISAEYEWKETHLIGGDPVYVLDDSHAVSINNYIDRIEIKFYERTFENGKYYCRITKEHILDAKKIKEDYEELSGGYKIPDLKELIYFALDEITAVDGMLRLNPDFIRYPLERTKMINEAFKVTCEKFGIDYSDADLRPEGDRQLEKIAELIKQR